MRIRRSLAAVLGGAVLAAAVLAPQVASASTGQTVVDKRATTLDEIVSTLVGPGVTVSNATFSGDDRAVGTFSGMKSALGLDKGVALSSGEVAGDLPGPHGRNLSTAFNTSGDPDLAKLVGGAYAPQDAAVLEFDFVPRSSSLSIDYVFGSAEYPRYVGAKFNDVFGFFVNGQNCALVGDKPVTVNTINHQSNADLFVDNRDGVRDTALNGFTKVLTCSATVKAGVTNHVKLAIADVGDASLDSAVLIGAKGFFSNQAPTAADASFTLNAGSSVEIGFPGSDADNDPLSYAIVRQPQNGALAVADADAIYTPQSGFIGQDSFTYTVSDGIVVAGPYTVTITVKEAAPTAPAISEIRYTAYSDTDTPLKLVPLDVPADATVATPAPSAAAGSSRTAVTAADRTGMSVVTAVAAHPRAATRAATLPLVYTITSPVQHGSLIGDGPVRVYRSAAGYLGSDSFAYTSTRDGVTTGPATVILDVIARPVPPVQSRSVPVFPPAPVEVDPPTKQLAATGLDTEGALGVAAIILFGGLAVTGVALLRRRLAR